MIIEVISYTALVVAFFFVGLKMGEGKMCVTHEFRCGSCANGFEIKNTITKEEVKSL